MRFLKSIFVILLMLSATALAESTLELPAQLQEIKSEAFAGIPYVTEIIVPDETESIGSRAFADSGLKIIYLPENITYIADDAFEGCTNVVAIVSDDSYAQKWCSEHGISYAGKIASASDFYYTIENGEVCLTTYRGNAAEVAIPRFINGYPVTSIGNHVFRNNDKLQSLICPAFLKSIGEHAFSGCHALSRVALNDGLISIGSSAFSSCRKLKQIDLPDSLTTIGHSAFYDSGLTSVTIPRGITQLENTTFCGSNLESIQLPDSLITIGDNVFADCNYLSEITLPSSLTTIGKSAFYWCNNLQAVTLPSSVEIIRNEAFSTCKALQSINLPASIASIGSDVFYNSKNVTATVQEHTYAQTWCLNNNISVNVIPCDFEFEIINGSAVITAYTGTDAALFIPSFLSGMPVTGIASGAFRNNLALMNVHFPATLVSIDSDAFSGCTKLTEITVPAELTDISSSAFSGCSNISTVYASAGTAGATTISNLGFDFTDKRDKTLIFSQSADTSGVPNLVICKYTGNATELDVPESFYDIKITGIGNRAFFGNDNLTKVNLCEGLLSIGELAFAQSRIASINLPTSLISIANNAFDDCVELLIFAFDGSYASKWCPSSGVNYYLDTTPNPEGDFTVQNLSATTCAITGYTGARKAVAIPSKINGRTVTTIALRAFDSNTNITSMVIPSTVTTIEYYAFYCCRNLTRLILNEGLKTIGGLAFYGCGIKELYVPDSVTSIEGGAFNQCRNLESIHLPERLKKIPDSLFYGCNALTHITLPSTVTSIGKHAFQGAGISEITIPSSIKTIGEMAFWNSRLTKVYISESVISIGTEAFLSKVTFYCPQGSYAAKWAASNGNKVVYE